MRRELILEFYRAWNRFISFYFAHIDGEEENIQPMLWKISTEKELQEIFRTILANQTSEELKNDLQIMLPAMNLHERADLINSGRASMPPSTFQALPRFVEQLLGLDEWATLKPRIGLG